jgi:hypothetical protein
MADLQEEIGALGLDRPMETLAGVQPVQNRIIVISGFRGSGKTTVAARILRAQPRLIVYDPNEDEAYGDWIPNTVHSIEGKRGLREYFRWAWREKKLAWVIRYVPEDGDLGQDAASFAASFSERSATVGLPLRRSISWPKPLPLLLCLHICASW